VVWANSGIDPDLIKDPLTFKYGTPVGGYTTAYNIPEDRGKGWGDICKEISQNQWHTPVSRPYWQLPDGTAPFGTNVDHTFSTFAEYDSEYNGVRTIDKTIFLPFTSMLSFKNGDINDGSHHFLGASLRAGPYPYVLGISNNSISFPQRYSSEDTAWPVRCVKEPAPGEGGEESVQQEEGFLAPAYTLAVDANNVLNLDGQNPVINGQPRPDNYVVAFKYGSLVALGMGKNGLGTTYNRDIHVAWTPPGYTLPGGSYDDIPYGDIDGVSLQGMGDPCAYAVKDGVVGGYMIPTSIPSMQQNVVPNADLGGQLGNFSQDGEFFLLRNLFTYSSGSIVTSNNSFAYYWLKTSTPQNNLYYSGGSQDGFDHWSIGHQIRCVPN
jgi:hypothetical protein